MYMVTGGSGFLGARIKTYFIKKGHDVAAPSHEELDLSDCKRVIEYIKNMKPAYVFHCAAISDAGYCREHEEASYTTNVEVVKNVAMACKETGAKLIFCSSDQVYFGGNGSEKIMGHRETEEAAPDDIYGKHKLLGEQICQQYCEDAVCLRLTWMYDVKKQVKQEHGNFYTTVMEALKQGKPCTFPIHDYRGITYVWSVIERLEQAMNLPGGVYNFGAENTCSTYDTVKALFDEKGISQKFLIPNEEAFHDRPRNISLDLTRLRNHGIDFENTFQELMKKIELGEAENE